jgi:PAS domain S-box-containing protein
MIIITWIISNVVEGSLINSGLLMSEVQETVNDVRIYAFTVGLSFLAIVWIFAFIFSGKVASIIEKLNTFMKNASVGILDSNIDIKRKDEFGVLAKSFQEVQIRLRQIADKVKIVAEGDFSVKVDVKSEKDELAISLNEMIEAFREKDEYTKTILNSTQAGVITVNAETHKIEYVNPAAAEIVGLSEDKIIGQICHKFICPAEKGKCPITDLGQSVDNSERVLLTSNGESVGILKSVKTIKLKDRKLLMETFIDISERKKSELTMKKVSAEMKQVLDATSPICGIDTEFNIFRVNESLCNLLGKEEKDIVGKKCYNLINVSVCKTEQCMLKKIMNGEDKVKTEVECNLNNGKTSNLSILSVPVKDTDGSLRGIVENLSNVTERVQYEKELKERNEEFERQNRIKTAQNELSNEIRGELDIQTIAKNIITFLAKHLKAQIGALYIYEEDSKELRIVGSYAFTKRKNLNDKFKIGEGLVGQAGLEREIISVTELPDDYIRINSALGDANPRNVVVIPLVYEENLIGVVELGSLKEFSDDDLEFLNVVKENIAVGLNLSQSRKIMKELLERSQQQSEELQTKQELLKATNETLEVQRGELKIANEELNQQAEKLKASREKLKQQQEELKVSNEELEEQTQQLKMSEEKLKVQQEELQASNEEL